MRERPILFSGPMIRAILTGQKTVTRRVVRAEHCPIATEPVTDAVIVERDGSTLREWLRFGNEANGLIEFLRPASRTTPHRSPTAAQVRRMAAWHARRGGVRWTQDEASGLCPYGVPGDTLWVRETWRADDFEPADTIYRADIPADVLAIAGDIVTWRPSIFLPRDRSRLTLRVVSVRVERLHDITTDDIAREGVRYPVSPDGAPLVSLTGKYPMLHYLPSERGTWRGLPPYTEDDLMRAAWGSLWDDVNHARAPWASNPWVWRVEFERVEASR